MNLLWSLGFGVWCLSLFPPPQPQRVADDDQIGQTHRQGAEDWTQKAQGSQRDCGGSEFIVARDEVNRFALLLEPGKDFGCMRLDRVAQGQQADELAAGGQSQDRRSPSRPVTDESFGR